MRASVVTVAEIFRDYYEPARDSAAIRRFLAAPLAVPATCVRSHRGNGSFGKRSERIKTDE